MNTLIFIGPLNMGVVPSAGDTMKNQMLYDRFVKVFNKVLVVDTFNWHKRPWKIIYLLILLFIYRKAKVVISANTDSAYKLIHIIGFLRFPNDFFYSVIGGAFANRMKAGDFNISTYKFLKGIFVEGESMVATLNSLGLTNAICVPNTKTINHYGIKIPKTDKKMHFVFLSRVEESKGCSDIIRSVDALNESGYKNKFDVVFFGKESDDIEYAQCFKKLVAEHDDVEYRGLLNLRDVNNYDELAKFDVMLFPTYWHGEGFPGIVIDAYIASLPIIASDWSLNRDLVEDGVTGWIIPAHDVTALTEQMKYTIDHPDEVCRLSGNCRVRAAQYDTSVVFSECNMKKFGLL